MKLIDGKAISSEILEECKEKASALKAAGIQPCLAVILVGEDPASQIYVRNKERACEKIGILSRKLELPAGISEEELIGRIRELNEDKGVHGILVQMPLPGGIDPEKVILAIDPAKDADGFHPYNVGMAWTGGEGPLSCTPAGVIQLLKRSGIGIEGKKCVIVGRSNIVGKPLACLMLKENATVSICHSRTR